jgi:hypothetical protein
MAMKKKVIELEVNAPYWRELVSDLTRVFMERIAKGRYVKKHIPDDFIFREQNSELRSNSVALINFGETVESDFVVSQIRSLSLRPLDMQRFLIIAKQKPELLDEGPIIDFVSIWRKNSDLVVPCIWQGSDSVPDLWLVSEPWGPQCWFAVAS